MSLLLMDRIFKRPFLWPGAVPQDREGCQFLFCLTKILPFYRSARPETVGRYAKDFLWRRSVVVTSLLDDIPCFAFDRDFRALGLTVIA